MATDWEAFYNESLKRNGVTPTPRSRKVKPPVTSEHVEQVHLIQWRDLNYLKYPGIELMHAIPNGGQRSAAVAGKLRAEGVQSGVSDLFLPVARRGFHGLYLEMKSTVGYASLAQTQWIESVKREGYAAFICYGAQSAIETLIWYYEREANATHT